MSRKSLKSLQVVLYCISEFWQIGIMSSKFVVLALRAITEIVKVH